MIAVIPYKQRGNGTELRYAMRSLEKHLTCLERVVLVGDKPNWYAGDHIPFKDEFSRKEYSIYQKLIQVKGTVFYSNDDYYLTKDADESFPNYAQGSCKDAALARVGRYKKLYQNCPPEWIDFDLHAPMIIDTTKFDWEKDRPIKTAYANQNNQRPTELTDLKFRSNQLTCDEIKAKIENRPCFSTDNFCFGVGMIRTLNELYPHKSKHER